MNLAIFFAPEAHQKKGFQMTSQYSLHLSFQSRTISLSIFFEQGLRLNSLHFGLTWNTLSKRSKGQSSMTKSKGSPPILMIYSTIQKLTVIEIKKIFQTECSTQWRFQSFFFFLSRMPHLHVFDSSKSLKT